ncbi:conjugative transposon protein TraK [Pedobacter sp. WC2423]|uniref:conjugative transposon protein TraK n=1 Tax=Pedobacter sp. WC2423 TaxID=3234142 RepID=UPI00346676F7
MFKQLQNIDTAFKHIKIFNIILILANVVMFCFYTYRSDKRIEQAENRVLLINNGKVIPVEVSDRVANLPVEVKDHIASFHLLFFTLAPDESVILSNIKKALYLADNSAKIEYDNLQENGYYSNIISGNISQRITVDSIKVNIDKLPYYFKCYATLKIVRTTSTVIRSLVTEGYVREQVRSDNNPHGFLIERWNTIENKDLKIENH